jgi:hypothetical protein
VGRTARQTPNDCGWASSGGHGKSQFGSHEGPHNEEIDTLTMSCFMDTEEPQGCRTAYTTDAGKYLDRVGDFLRRRPVEHSVLLNAASTRNR